MKNKLIKLLSESGFNAADYCSKTDCEDCRGNYEFGGGCLRELEADYLIANGVTIQKWISVKDMLPENDYNKPWADRKHYLVCSFWGRMTVATFGYKEYLWWIDSHDCVLSEKNIGLITHWMHLPEQPKEK